MLPGLEQLAGYDRSSKLGRGSCSAYRPLPLFLWGMSFDRISARRHCSRNARGMAPYRPLSGVGDLPRPCCRELANRLRAKGSPIKPKRSRWRATRRRRSPGASACRVRGCSGLRRGLGLGFLVAVSRCGPHSRWPMQFRLVPLLCTVSLLCAGSPALTQQAQDRLWFHGPWAEDQAWCKARPGGRSDERPIVITPDGSGSVRDFLPCRASPADGRPDLSSARSLPRARRAR
jgi:hypothetical protein